MSKVSENKNLALLTVLVIAGLVLLLMPLPIIWAMPPQSPMSQGTIPPKPKDGEGEPGPPPTPTTPPSLYIEFNKKIDSNGGSLDLWLIDGHCLLIQILPGAFNEEVAFQVKTIEPYKAPADNCAQPSNTGDSKISCKTTIAYTLKAWRAAGGEIPPTEKIAPYKHVICYTAADLALAGNDPNNLVIAYYDEAKNTWVALPTTIDAANKRTIATADHLSWWALMAIKPAKTEAAAPEAEVTAERLPVTGNDYGGILTWLSFVVSLIGLVMIFKGAMGIYRHFRKVA